MRQNISLQNGSKVLIVLFTAIVMHGCGEDSKPVDQSAKPVQSAEKVPVLTAQINTSPLFETPQGWGAGFAKAKVDDKGVVVGPGAENPNVFAQQFPAKAGDQFKLIARASSAGKPNAKGRFQINWIDKESKFLSVSMKAFDVTTEEKTFEYFITAPAGAIAGTLYVVPDGQEDVVRYTEMRVLGKEKVKAN